MNRPILIVDDNEDVRVLLARILKLLDEEVVCVSGGGEAIQYLRDETPKLVLLDLMMPDVDGLTVLREIRSRPDLAGLPVVVFSGAGEKEVRQALAEGADDCLLKGSATIEDFQASIRRFDRQRRERGEQWKARPQGSTSVCTNNQACGWAIQ